MGAKIKLLSQLKNFVPILFGLLLFVGIKSLGLYSTHILKGSAVDILVTAQVTGGQTIEIFTDSERGSLPLKPGEVTYRFSGLSPMTRSLRIDPTDRPSEVFRILSVQVIQGGNVIQSVTGEESQSWEYFESESVEKGYRSTTSDPKVVLPQISPATILSSVPQIRVADFLKNNLAFPKFFVVIFIAVILIAAFSGQIPAKSLLMMVLFFFFISNVVVIPSLEKINFESMSAAKAAGYSSYIGYSKSKDYARFFVALAGSLLTVLALVWWRPRLFEMSRGPAIDSTTRLNRHEGYFFLCLVGLIAFFSFPDLQHSLLQVLNPRHSSDWDFRNMLLWQYLDFSGSKPLRDFWFPYGEAIFYWSPFPLDVLKRWLHVVFFLGLLGYSMYHVTGKSKLRLLVFFGLFGACASVGVIHSVDRYLPVLSALLYMTLVSNPAREKKNGHGMLAGMVIFWVFFLEPNQVINLAVSGGALLGIEFITGSSNAWKRLKKLLTPVLTFVVFLALYLIWLDYQDRLTGFFDFYLHVGEFIDVAAIPADVSSWFKLAENIEAMVTFSTFLILSGGIVVKWKQIENESADALIGIAFLLMFVFVKQIMRPHMASQMTGYVFVGIFILLSNLVFQNRSVFNFILAGVLASAILPLNPLGFLNKQLSLIAKAPFSAIFEKQAQGEKYFSPSAFRFGEVTGEDLRTYISSNFPNARDIYAFGDLQYIPIVLQSKPYYISNIYDSSSIRGQNLLLNELKSRKPDLVIWKPNEFAIGVDGVPSVLRTPKVSAFLVQNYRFSASRYGLDFLVRRDAEPIDWHYWFRVFGNQLDLGYLNSERAVARFSNCEESGCLKFARLAAGDGNPRVEIRIGAHTAQVSWKPFNRDRSEIFLSRLWFWEPALSVGVQPEVLTSGVEVINLSPPSREVLY